MNAGRRILLLNGSPKANGGTSGAIVEYFRERLGERGCATGSLVVKQAVASPNGTERLLSEAASADTLVLAFPLYIDSLPYPVVKALELIAEQRAGSTPRKTQQLLAVSNSGFPEAHQNETALAICRQFAREAGIEWAGGLALGGGQSIDGKPLEKAGWLTRNVRKSLDLAADALGEGLPLSPEAAELMSKPLVPGWLYVWIGESGGKRRARENRAFGRIADRPYKDRSH